ncbi:response regulator, partial [Streptomyces sp. ISL-14]|nr:response regulator [Streptomyces sp. ISL-14]
MPVPIPRQRAIPAVESGQAQAASTGGGTSREEAPRKEETVENTTHTNLTLLLIEDDPGGSAIVPELLDSAGKPIRVRTARNLTEAERLLTDDVHCILLDLALSAPGRLADDDELAVLKHVLELAPRHAVLALTASGDAERGAEAVRVGAQDYLFRDELDGRLLSRAIRYAVERKRSDTAERRLAEGRMRAQENRRLERGLL